MLKATFWVWFSNLYNDTLFTKWRIPGLKISFQDTVIAKCIMTFFTFSVIENLHIVGIVVANYWLEILLCHILRLNGFEIFNVVRNKYVFLHSTFEHSKSVGHDQPMIAHLTNYQTRFITLLILCDTILNFKLMAFSSLFYMLFSFAYIYILSSQ